MDLARRSPEYLEQMARHHVGGQLKVAPEHVSDRVLAQMKKPPQQDFEAFTEAFTEASRRAGKRQTLVPYFIASHPGSTLEDMIELAVFLERNGHRPDQVQDFIPAPMDLATATYYTGLDPKTLEPVPVARNLRDRRLQRALLQFFKPENYFEVRKALESCGRQDLIGDGPGKLIPSRPPPAALAARRRRAESEFGKAASAGRRPDRGSSSGATQSGPLTLAEARMGPIHGNGNRALERRQHDGLHTQRGLPPLPQGQTELTRGRAEWTPVDRGRSREIHVGRQHHSKRSVPLVLAEVFEVFRTEVRRGEFHDDLADLLRVGGVGRLLAFHGRDGESVHQLELLQVLLTRLAFLGWLDPLGEPVRRDFILDLLRVLFLGHDPTDDLVVVLLPGGAELDDLRHRFLDRRRIFLPQVDAQLVSVDPTGDLAVDRSGGRNRGWLGRLTRQDRAGGDP